VLVFRSPPTRAPTLFFSRSLLNGWCLRQPERDFRDCATQRVNTDTPDDSFAEFRHGTPAECVMVAEASQCLPNEFRFEDVAPCFADVSCDCFGERQQVSVCQSCPPTLDATTDTHLLEASSPPARLTGSRPPGRVLRTQSFSPRLCQVPEPAPRYAARSIPTVLAPPDPRQGRGGLPAFCARLLARHGSL